MLTRRDWLSLTLGAGAALTLDPTSLLAQQKLLTRAVPATGEMLPVIGLGSSATFSQVARTEDVTALRDVLKTLVERRRDGVRYRARLRGVRGSGRPHRRRDRADRQDFLGHQGERRARRRR